MPAQRLAKLLGLYDLGVYRRLFHLERPGFRCCAAGSALPALPEHGRHGGVRLYGSQLQLSPAGPRVEGRQPPGRANYPVAMAPDTVQRWDVMGDPKRNACCPNTHAHAAAVAAGVPPTDRAEREL